MELEGTMLVFFQRFVSLKKQISLRMREERKKVKSFSHVQLFATPWTVAHEAPPSMGFSRQEYWSGLPFPSPGDLPNPGIKPGSPALQTDALTSEPPGKPRNHYNQHIFPMRNKFVYSY